MGRRVWLAVAIGALVAASFAATVVATKRSAEDRPKTVTRGLDYLHARQGVNGGFGSAENTAWSVLGAVASGERMTNDAWHVKGKNPFDYLQSTDLAAASTGADVSNAPVYYARLIMAYVAMDRAGAVGTAGSRGVNLLTLLLAYQNTTVGSDTTGAFSPVPSSTLYAVRTTSWALLAMDNLGLSQSDARVKLAEQWLAAQQNTAAGGDGGFSSDAGGGQSDALDTGLAIQALKATSGGQDWDAAAARAFLKSSQKPTGGFPSDPHGDTNAEATSAAIQAILAVGERPEDPGWTVNAGTPIDALARLQKTTGAYKLTSRQSLRSVTVTSWALIALRRRPFTSYPRTIGPAETAFRFRPHFASVSPKNGTEFTHSRSVLIRATYTDRYPKGTGIKPSACRVYVDNVNRTRAADIGDHGLHLQLKNVPNGDHTCTIKIVDHAGNERLISRKFTVAVPTPTPTQTPLPRPTYNPGPVYPTAYPTHTTPAPYTTPTPTPYGSTTPYPYPSPSTSGSPVVGSPLPSASASASPAAGSSGDGGSAAGFVGGTLLAMLPIGAVISYLALHRREDLLDGASQGQALEGGGSSWDRFKQALARSKDLTKPSSRG